MPEAATTVAFRRVVDRRLAKDPNRRWQSARDVMLELESIALAEGGRAKPLWAWAARAPVLGWIVAAVFAVLSLLLGLARWRASEEPGVVRFSISPPEKAT